MQIANRINAIEARARAINLTLAELCRLAGVHYSTVQRWRSADGNPKLRTVDDVLGRLDGTLAGQEAEILATLQNRHPDTFRPVAA